MDKKKRKTALPMSSLLSAISAPLREPFTPTPGARDDTICDNKISVTQRRRDRGEERANG
jgi:hypothetical protein